MNLDFIDRVIKTSLILIAIVFPFAAFYIGLAFTISILLGCIWGCANLFLIRLLVTKTIGAIVKNKVWLIIIIFIKFPLLYFVGYLLIKWKYLSPYGLLCGFSAIFVVTVLKVASRSILKADSKLVKVL
jgi:hypothetical protein